MEERENKQRGQKTNGKIPIIPPNVNGRKTANDNGGFGSLGYFESDSRLMGGM